MLSVSGSPGIKAGVLSNSQEFLQSDSDDSDWFREILRSDSRGYSEVLIHSFDGDGNRFHADSAGAVAVESRPQPNADKATPKTDNRRTGSKYASAQKSLLSQFLATSPTSKKRKLET